MPARKAMPARIKLEVRLKQNGRCGCRKGCGAKLPPDGKGLVQYQHEPALALRLSLYDDTDWMPAQHDTKYIFAELVACHAVETYGGPSKATTAGTDIANIWKVKRLRGELKPKMKREWPSRKMQSRPWPK